ncbi:BQ5605_C006g03937 [Microbotryum silenes-dioicae]|uniref:BQ5605_C006g03937 protein n=1 Tax=Microbotryum silenes-dioicae TaxID=796604 RepID=A0A2X0P1H0_9BASI|nr:BQ5605_C006g03937 [Microbotryum silenes-dioicae]
MLTRIFAAGLSNAIDLRIVAPSLVTVISPVEVECKILFMPLGPRVDLTRSPRARAPTKDERRACVGTAKRRKSEVSLP